MPTFDGGHGFLTALLPISTRSAEAASMPSSPVHLVRELLAALPTADQSPFTPPGYNSPFKRNLKTHFLRMAVIDDVVFNGRVNKDTLLGGQDPTVPQPVDSLNCPYLLFSADFDAPHGEMGELDAYLAELWDQVRPELGPILKHCDGFDEAMGSADFVAFIRACMIDTTMPFNDYWPDAPPLKDPDHVTVAAGTAALWLVTCFLVFWLTQLAGWHGGWHILLSVLAGSALFVWLALKIVARWSERPFPRAPGSDLPSVLKSLHLQRAFTAFAMKPPPGGSGGADAALYDAFGAFLAEHRPSLNENPTQPPGIVPSAEAHPAAKAQAAVVQANAARAGTDRRAADEVQA